MREEYLKFCKISNEKLRQNLKDHLKIKKIFEKSKIIKKLKKSHTYIFASDYIY